MTREELANELRKDGRYSVALEYCGQPTAVYVVRFCGAWVGWQPDEQKAYLVAADYHSELTGIPHP